MKNREGGLFAAPLGGCCGEGMDRKILMAGRGRRKGRPSPPQLCVITQSRHQTTAPYKIVVSLPARWIEIASLQANQPANRKSKIVNIQLIVPLPLHELARIVRKSAIFPGGKNAKSL